MSQLEEIAAFVAIARAGSISEAARQAHLAKSVMSRRLSDLEARLGAPLIVRTTRRMALTDAGAAFLQRAERLLDDLGEAEAEVRADAVALAGRLRIAAPLSYGLSRLKPVVSDFMRRHPGVKMEIDFSDRQVSLVEEGFDLALRIGALANSSLIARKIAPVRSLAAASPAFWDQYGRPRAPSDLEKLPCLRYANLPRPEVIPYWAPGGARGEIAPPIRMRATNGDFLADLAVDGAGFLVEPAFIIEPYIRDGRLETALTDYAWSDINLYLIYPPTRRPSARAARVRRGRD